MSRDSGLDFLRGLAILGMVLSGTISRNDELPGWLFHAQISPPDFVFNPSFPGITWVDLVFPLFIFAMGMSVPFSLQKNIDKGSQMGTIGRKIFFRALKLWFFAIMLGHLSLFHYPAIAGYWANLLAVLAFGGFFLAFLDFSKLSLSGKWWNTAGYLLLILLCLIRARLFDLPFSLQNYDIIILVLANMAFWGGLIWLITRNNMLVRLGILALYFGIWLSRDIEGSWNNDLWNFLPLWWLADQIPAFGNLLQSIGIENGKTIFYHPDYLKYLMIFLPGTIVGDLVIKHNRSEPIVPFNKSLLLGAAMILLIVGNLFGLYYRFLLLNLFVNLFLLTLIFISFIVKELGYINLYKKLVLFAIFWVLLGLVFEAWQGGIKKDPATYSYFFLTTGFSIFVYLSFHLLHNKSRSVSWWRPVLSIGKNPMLAYVLVAYLILPVLGALQLQNPLDHMHEIWKWAGVFRGLLLTTIMIFVTVFFVRKKLFWKT
ncbi:MAG: DUF5009 domain-containing protein [Bacteroides sp.]|jgi:predicted acyltransferase|nr:DUF5009 domain-containing protein [Bacteroides sp.]